MQRLAQQRMLVKGRQVITMIRPQAVWNGTEAESRALLAAIARYCACQFADNGALAAACPSHDALVRNQRFLDGLLFGRRIGQRLIQEEWKSPCKGEVTAPTGVRG
jgi:hypothetical protein